MTTTNPMLKVLKIRDFRLLWLGGSISILGSQFSFIALPWLVLQLTGDPLALGAVLALGGIPRAAFMLIGGAITDRFSARTILLICDWINFVLSAIVAVLIFTGLMQTWILYLFSLITGLLSGFVMPAASSIVPSLVPEEDLQAGNSIITGSQQLIGFTGPALAGAMIGIYAHSAFGITVAFAIDALTFGISAMFLSMMRSERKQTTKADEKAESIWRSIGVAAVYLMNQTSLQFLFITMAAVNFLVTGPLMVGIPVLANQRLPEGAMAFGLLMSAYAGGGLGGYVLGGMLPKPSGRGLSIFLVALLVAFAVVLGSFGWITLTWVDFVLMLLLGIGNGYMGLMIFTWIQQRTPREMLGRVMSMVMLASMGLAPLSQTLAGAILRWDVTGLFALTGGLILLLAIWSAFQPGLRALGDEMANE